MSNAMLVAGVIVVGLGGAGLYKKNIEMEGVHAICMAKFQGNENNCTCLGSEMSRVSSFLWFIPFLGSNFSPSESEIEQRFDKAYETCF